MPELGGAEAISTKCRLCEGETAAQFTLPILDRYDVTYHRCGGCGCLQTDHPFWLAESYGADVPVEDVIIEKAVEVV